MLTLWLIYGLQGRLEIVEHEPSLVSIYRQIFCTKNSVEFSCINFNTRFLSLINPKYCSNHLLEWHLQYAYFSKALNKLSSSEDYKRTRQGALAVLLLYLYKYNVVHATTISTSPYVYVSTSCPSTHLPCFYLKATMLCPCALTSYSL